MDEVYINYIIYEAKTNHMESLELYPYPFVLVRMIWLEGIWTKVMSLFE